MLQLIEKFQLFFPFGSCKADIDFFPILRNFRTGIDEASAEVVCQIVVTTGTVNENVRISSTVIPSPSCEARPPPSRRAGADSVFFSLMGEEYFFSFLSVVATLLPLCWYLVAALSVLCRFCVASFVAVLVFIVIIYDYYCVFWTRPLCYFACRNKMFESCADFMLRQTCFFRQVPQTCHKASLFSFMPLHSVSLKFARMRQYKTDELFLHPWTSPNSTFYTWFLRNLHNLFCTSLISFVESSSHIKIKSLFA